MKRFLNNWIVRNLLLAAAVILLFYVSATLLLHIVTNHGQKLGVPDFSGMTLNEASSLASASDMRLDVVDSIYVAGMPRGSIVKQEPKAGSSVKEGRRIQLTINALTPKREPMPNLVGYSLRSAQAEIEARGFVLRRLIYVRDMATNNVLKQLYDSREIEPGEMLSSGSGIDLVLGLSANDRLTNVPEVRGKQCRAAVSRLHERSLNIGRLHFDKDVRSYRDSLEAVVYRQIPDTSARNIPMGSDVSLYLTLDKTKVAVFDVLNGADKP